MFCLKDSSLSFKKALICSSLPSSISPLKNFRRYFPVSKFVGSVKFTEGIPCSVSLSVKDLQRVDLPLPSIPSKTAKIGFSIFIFTVPIQFLTKGDLYEIISIYMDSFGNWESNENSVMGPYFSILKFFGVIFYFGLFHFYCFSPTARTEETESEIQEILSGESDRHSSLLRYPKNKVRVHHIFEEVYPSSSASSVSILAEKTTKSRFLHSKGGHFLEKVLITLGYGIVLNPQGYILTNAHVIGTYDHLLVKSKSGKSYEAVIIGQDKKSI